MAETSKLTRTKTRAESASPPPAPKSGGKPPRRGAGCLGWGIRLGVLGAVLAGIVGVAALVFGAAAYRYYVVANPGPQLDREHIRTIIAQESPVYYRDGTTRVGVFFENEHRLFVPFGEMPRAYVMGIVAAEDGRFWTHSGVNPKGILRAMRDNLLAGDMVAGGSTLTQQTAKNLYYRPDRSARSKIIELLNALRLEAHFDKTEILEFYANQFHVSGNGRGLGIAARHFFDKDPDQLSVAECAFIAGLVKGPTNYDPFLGDEARREKAIRRAHDRTRYVLRRMIDEPIEHLAGPVPKSPAEKAAFEARKAEATQVRAEAKRLLDEGFELPFRRGTFRYESSAILDEVALRLSEPPFDQMLGKVGIDDPRNAGLIVVTTLDSDAQRESTWALWHHLTEVGLWLEGLGPEAFVLEGNKAPRFDPDFPPHGHEFRVARVVSHDGAAGKKTLTLDLGGHPCVVDRDGVVRVAVASTRGKKKSSSLKVPSADVDAWIAAIPDESVVLVSVRSVPRTGPAVCDLEVRPELQGAVTVLQDGEIRAMVGGNDNRNFNRATALRQFGSTWKPLVYHAALTLGWSPDDVIDNTRNVFPYSTTFYYPHPDHEPSDRVSIAWAGVNSENLASIWLLYHLTDRLDGEQVRALATATDVAQRPDELADAYRARITSLGIHPTADRIEEGLFLQSRQEVLTGLPGDAHPEDAVALQSLLFGWGFAAERTRAEREPASTRAWKLRALTNDWRWLDAKIPACRSQYDVLARSLRNHTAPDAVVVRDLSVKLVGERIEVACGATPPEGYVAPNAAFVASVPWGAVPDEGTPTVPEVAPAPTEPHRRKFPFFGGGSEDPAPAPAPHAPSPGAGPSGPALVAIDDLLLEGRLHLSTMASIRSAFDRRKELFAMSPDASDPFDPEVLYWHPDIRTLMAMRYIASLAEDYGVQTEIKEVLSMPLGASEITLEEATSLYAGLVTGTGVAFTGSTPNGAAAPLLTSTALIQEIRNLDGRVLYRSEAHPTVVVEPKIGALTADILRNVVLFGTGQRAKAAVDVGGHWVPVGGKTGTTNDYRNAAFVGYVPRTTPMGFAIPGGFTIGAYVGYDDNRSMVNGKIKLAGASAALPAWIGAAEGVARSGMLGEPPSAPAGDEGWTIATDPSLVRVTVDEHVGLPMVDGPGTILTRAPSERGALAVALTRLLRPARAAPGTDQALPEGATPVPPPPSDDPFAAPADAPPGDVPADGAPAETPADGVPADEVPGDDVPPDEVPTEGSLPEAGASEDVPLPP